MTPYLLLKYLHVALAIVAVGFNASYAVWLARAERDPAHQAFALRGVKFLDDRIANPAYGLLLFTGMTLVLVGRFDFRIFWIAAGLALWAVVMLGGLAVYTPTLRKQIEVLDRTAPRSRSTPGSRRAVAPSGSCSRRSCSRSSS